MIIYKPLDLENLAHFRQIKKLIDADLSEPYSIYVYRYFLNRWSELAYLAFDNDCNEPDTPIGCVVCKNEMHRGRRIRGYIGMLAVESKYRGQGIAKTLVTKAIEKMAKDGCDEIMLEAEVENQIALNLYENMGFIRMKRMFRYYLNEGDAFKLILPLTEKSCIRTTFLQDSMMDKNLIVN